MKVLFHHLVPFTFAHGGLQVQIHRTREALLELGVQVEFLRWYDGNQAGDVLHFFGRIPLGLLELAQENGMKVVVADLLTEQGSRSATRLRLQRWVMRALNRTLPSSVVAYFDWESYRRADACVALTSWEAYLLSYLFGAPEHKIHVVPNGVENVFLDSRPVARGRWLVCTATITERKRILELAQAAIQAQTPLWIIGEPYSDSDPYAQRFFGLAKAHPQMIRYEGPIHDRGRLAAIYREARGFVLLSACESLSLSALESAACQCPLLLSDLPWARSAFAQSVSYCPLALSTSERAEALRKFYDDAPELKAP